MRGSNKFEKGGWGDLLWKESFLKKGRLNLRAMHLPEKYETKEFYF